MTLKIRHLVLIAAAIVCALVLMLLPDTARAAPNEDEHITVTARVVDRTGEDIGFVALSEMPRGVMVQADVHGLTPGKHAFHFHETGSCDAPAFTSAGGHFAPDGAAHGFAAPGGEHAGDMPNQIVPGDGNLLVSLYNDDVRLRRGPTPLLDADGSALVIHAGFDDYESQPSGAAGVRVACAEIGRELLTDLTGSM